MRSILIKTKALLLAFMLLTLTYLMGSNILASTAKTGMRNLTSLEIVNDMKLGWNLGNTFDAGGAETNWGNPVTTHAMIDKLKQQGFKTIRIPITWGPHMGGAPNYTIDSAWLNRIEEVINYAFDNDMYVIINTHHDTSWIVPTYAHQEQTINQLTKVWTQIANKFKDYGDYLIFETMNEPRLVGSAEEWSGGTAEGRDVINKFNLAAVNAIRSTGGNNATRFILIPTYGASATSNALNDMVIPNNDKKIIVSVHMYSPYTFAMQYPGTSTWGSDSDKASLDWELDAVANKFIKKGWGVIIGEFGSVNKNNLSSRVVHAEYYVKAARARGITPIWWDNNIASVGEETFGIFNRKALTWYFPEVANALVRGAGINPQPTSTPTNQQPTPTLSNQPVGGNYIVSYAVQSWGNGGVVNITIKNNSSTAINNWALNFTFPGNQVISNAWNCEKTQSGSSVTLKNLGYNATIPANGSVGIGFCYNGADGKPSGFKLNGVECQVQ